MIHKKTLIIGTGRCGTKYIAKLLSEAGLEVGHEVMLRDGMADWRSTVIEQPPEWIVLHQVREPLRTIGSLQTFSDESWEYIRSHLQLPSDLLGMCMTYYLEWNRLAAEAALFTYRVEEIGSIWKAVCNTTGLEEEAPMPSIPKDTNTRRLSYTPFYWRDLEDRDAKLVEEIRRQGEDYGYEMLYDD